MDDGLKQRLIGAFVLLALGVIFIPVLFDRERIEPVDKRTQIPLAPLVESIVIESAVPPEIEHAAEPATEMFVPDENEVETTKLEVEPTFDSNGVPNSWVIQVASFRFEKHAKELRDILIKDEYAAYTRNVSTDRGKMTRLYVGPKFDKNILISQKKEIEKEHKLSVIILKFEP